MIYVNNETCNGCGACLEICPENAIVIQNAVAYIDEELCKGCEHCVDSCPQGAILCVDLMTNETMVSHPEKESQIIPVTGALDQSPHRPGLLYRALPVLGSTLIWAGREILPHLAPLVLLPRRLVPFRVRGMGVGVLMRPAGHWAVTTLSVSLALGVGLALRMV